MLRALLSSALAVACLLLSAGPARAQHADGAALFEAPLPGGLKAALAATDDRATPDRALFLYEFIRRTYDVPLSEQDTPRSAFVLTLIAHLDRAAAQKDGTPATADTVPLPLDPQVWTEVIFAGRATPQTLVRSILASRSAALVYCGLLNMDDDTRAWLGNQRGLLTEIVERHAAPFAIASRGLRVSGGSMVLPGGAHAAPVWGGLAGEAPHDPAKFIRALLSHREGRLAYMFGAASLLTPAQLSMAFRLTAPREDDRIDAGRRLYALFEKVSAGWVQDARPFWRPILDPFLLLSGLNTTPAGVPALPGTRAFWTAALAEDDDLSANADAAARASTGEPVDFVWLCEQVFKGSFVVRRPPYKAVLFASRNLTRLTPGNARDAVEAVRAVARYPALVKALERARVTDLSVFAAAARRAEQLSRLDDDPRALRAIAQFQGLLVLVTHATMRGSVPAASLPGHVASLTAVEPNSHGEYDGRLARWLDGFLQERVKAGAFAAPVPDTFPDPFDDGAGPADRQVLRLLAGTPDAQPQLAEWEGTRYRLEFGAAEALRLARLLGDDARPYLAAAIGVAQVADTLAGPARDPGDVPAAGERLHRIARVLRGGTGGEADPDSANERCRRAAEALDRAAAQIAGPARRRPALEATLRLLSDDLLGFGLMQAAYAAAMGQPDRAAVPASEAAGRHDFMLNAIGLARRGPWMIPAAGAERARDWRVTGSLLGLDLCLADFSLVRLSMRLPPRRPSVAGEDRRTFVETAVLVDPRALTDGDRDQIVAALAKGRARAASLRTMADAAAVSTAIGLDTLRRNLLAWTVAHDPDRAPAFLDPAELLRLGAAGSPLPPRLHAWGVTGDARLGCECLQFADDRALFAGRWTSGILATGFPDLNLRLTELLAGLRMPASLLAPVLAAATLDFINVAEMRDPDDRRGLVTYVESVDLERVEQYLALLTTDGPLVPIGGSAPDAGASGQGAHVGGDR